MASFIKRSVNKAVSYLDGLIKKAIEIRLCPRNIIRDRSFSLSQFWYL
jgi:hypothetical protein